MLCGLLGKATDTVLPWKTAQERPVQAKVIGGPGVKMAFCQPPIPRQR
jgi:hypothetical protein